VRSTQADYGRVMDVLLAGGMAGSQPFLSTETLAFMAYNQAAGKVVINTPSPETFGYGIGQWVEAVDAKGLTTRVSSPGAFGMTPWVDWAAGSNGIIFVQDTRTRIEAGLYDVQNLALAALSVSRSVKPPIAKPQLYFQGTLKKPAVRPATGKTDR
jgi:CubicO group peptidase (beta-lactamase class C family)